MVAEHARRVQAVFKKHGVKTVITIDPHTTTMLRSVYPKLLEGYDVEVRSYLEVLAEKGLVAERPTAASGRRSSPRSSCTTPASSRATKASSTSRASCWRPPASPCATPRTRGRQTWCCGGPIESLYPAKAAANAAKRVAQLRAVGARLRHHVPDVFRQPEHRGRRHDALHGHLAVPARGLRILRIGTVTGT